MSITLGGARAAALAVLFTPALLAGQATPRLGPESPNAPVLVLSAALYTEQANVREASDADQATIATEVIRSRLTERLGRQLVPFGVTDSLVATPEALEAGGGQACNVKVSCALTVAKQAGARWVVMTKVSKTSNLIWLLSAQLIRVENGEIILDDSTELKGDPGPMVRIGVRSFADRVARTVLAGGFTTNYPSGEPTF